MKEFYSLSCVFSSDKLKIAYFYLFCPENLIHISFESEYSLIKLMYLSSFYCQFIVKQFFFKFFLLFIQVLFRLLMESILGQSSLRDNLTTVQYVKFLDS